LYHRPLHARTTVALVRHRRRLRKRGVPFRVVLARSHMRRMLVLVVMSLACKRGEGHGTDATAVFDVRPDRAQIGYDAPFSISVHFRDAGREEVDVRWTQLGGPALRDIAVSERGYRFSARTARLSECREGPLPWGVVPLSPRTRGEVVLQAEWRLASAAVSHRERIVVAAATRSRGLPNVPIDQRLYLGGAGWRIMEAPPEGRATLEERDGVTTLRPDARGIWQLSDGDGRALRIQAGRYVETPLDCGRSGCHVEIARAVQSSPMTWALARRLQERGVVRDAPSAETQPAKDLSCALACHTTGEPGIHDGGFFDVASDLRISSSLEGVSETAQLPRVLRRLGSVGCLACHGPSALPEADARWSILRSDVCAHCHDAPPRYGHVVAWRTTSMARADQDPRARSDRACTSCHTTWGFLEEIGRADAREDEIRARVPPEGVGMVGIACPACHGVHEASADSRERRHLLRAPRLPAMFDDVPAEARAQSATCIACHAPREAARPSRSERQRAETVEPPLAQASASALWAGRAGIDPETGAPLVAPSPHLAVEGGCVGCHTGGPDAIEHGQSHSFRADGSRCTSCHDGARNVVWADERARIEKQARALWSNLLALGALVRAESAAEPTSKPPHATTVVKREAPQPLARAAYDLSLLLEDRGFFAHNLPYARLLLEKAQQPIDRAARAAPLRQGERDR